MSMSTFTSRPTITMTPRRNPSMANGKLALPAVFQLQRPDEVPPPPATLSTEAASEWRRFWAANRPATADLAVVESYARLVGLVRQCDEAIADEGLTVASDGSAPRAHPAVRTMLDATPLILACADALG